MLISLRWALMLLFQKRFFYFCLKTSLKMCCVQLYMIQAQETLRSYLRMRPRNKVCAIKRCAITDCKIVFHKITEQGYVRAYDADSLYKYFSTILENDAIDLLTWPVCRELVASIEVKRLENILKIPQSRRVTTLKNLYWGQIFLDTLQQSVAEMINELASLIIGTIESSLDDVADLTSNFTASLLYIYLLSKTKWRRIKNGLRHQNACVNRVLGEIKFLSEEMCNLFCEHDLILSWRGSQIVPIIMRLNVPANLRS